MRTTIAKWDDDVCVKIPRPILEALEMGENDIVDIGISDNTITIKKPRRGREVKKGIVQRYEEFYGVDFETACRENPNDNELVDWGPPVGSEVW
ncbi:MAG: hypothetical protein FWB71_02065 [Defluviitaleaceae bacterium]|nr:hypothetical protein [Defluviitaleaceae bacterium]